MEDKKFTIFDYDKDKGCLFYEKVSSYEDADPYLDNKLLVVCDGCGGAGGFYHLVNKDMVDSYEKIKKLVLPEDKEDNLKEYLEKLFAPIISIEGETVKKTSAFWASRIVMPRFIYAYKTLGKDNIEEVKDFIIKGMMNVRDSLSFEESDMRDKVLLPTTFVAIDVDKENDKEIELDVYWSGDSRAYYLSPEGLKQLSKDDEDATGALTNLFGFKNTLNTMVHHKHYCLKKPCILFTCSDGVFDVYNDNLTLEYVLLHWLVEANNMDELASMLAKHYNACKADDTTLALHQYGYSSYAEIKEAYKERLAYDEALFIKKRDLNFAYQLAEDPSIFPNIVRRLVSRTKDVFLDISIALEDAIKNNNEDPLLDDLKADVSAIYKKASKKEKAPLGDEKILNKIKDIIAKESFLRDNDIADFFDISKMDKKQKEDFASIMEMQEKANAYDELLREREDLDEEYQNELLPEIHDALHDIFIDSCKALEGNTNKASLSVPTGKFYMNKEGGLNEPTLELLKRIDNGKYYDKYVEIFVKITKNDLEIRDFEKENGRGLFSKTAFLLKEFFKDNGIETLSLIKRPSGDDRIDALLFNDETQKEIIDKKEEKTILEIIQHRYGDDEGNKVLVIKRINLGKNTKIIDRFYNATLLNNAINYYEASKVDPTILEAFRNEYNKYEESFEELLDK